MPSEWREGYSARHRLKATSVARGQRHARNVAEGGASEQVTAIGLDEVGVERAQEPPLVGRRAYAGLVVFGILLCLLMGALDNFVVLTALKAILIDFNAPSTGQTFIVSAYLITSTVAIPVFAKLSDLFDRKRVFISGLLIFIGGSVLSGLSQNLNELIAFRAVQGFGSGDFFPVGLAIVAVIFPPETRARVTGLLSGVFGIATVAGPFIGNFIVQTTTWRWVFYVNIPVGAVGLLILLLTLGPIRPEHRDRFDLVGSGLLAGWVATLMFPLVEVSQPGTGWSWSDPRLVALLVTAVVLAVGFVLWELRTPTPLVPLRLFRRRVIATCSSGTFIVGLIIFPLATFLTLFINYVTFGGAGDPSATVRDVLYALVIPLVFGAATGGLLLSRITYRAATVLGLAVGGVGLFFLRGIGASTPVWTFVAGVLPSGGIILPLIPLGFGVGITFPVFLLAVQNQADQAEVGAATGLVQFFQSLGGALGLTLLSSYQELRIQDLSPALPSGGCPPNLPPSPACISYGEGVVSATSTASQEVFTIMFVLLLLGLVASLFITGRMPRSTDARPPALP